MAPKFGTSGLRGLVVELTPALVADHVAAFLRACPLGTQLRQLIAQVIDINSARLAFV
jgi:hypothetical protein